MPSSSDLGATKTASTKTKSNSIMKFRVHRSGSVSWFNKQQKTWIIAHIVHITQNSTKVRHLFQRIG